MCVCVHVFICVSGRQHVCSCAHISLGFINTDLLGEGASHGRHQPCGYKGQDRGVAHRAQCDVRSATGCSAGAH